MTPNLTATVAPHSTPVGNRILEVASQLFYHRGINATGVDLIVEQAGTTKRTLYQRFGSKDALVAAYLQGRAHTWQTYVLDALEPADTRVAEIEAVYDAATAWARTNPRGCAFVNAWAEIATHDSDAARVVQEEKAWMRSLFTHVAEDADLGEALHLLYEGAQACATIGRTLSPFESASRTSRRLLGAAAA